MSGKGETSAPVRGGAPHPAVAGSFLLATIVVFAAAGFGVGALIGAVAPFLLAGVLVGLVAGVAVVYARFRGV